MHVAANPATPASESRLAILGGCGGIGRALVIESQVRGLQVCVLDLAESLERHPLPEGVNGIAIDATDPDSLQAGFATLASNFGAIDGFVNLCGFMIDNQPLADTGVASWREAIDGNLSSVFNAAMLALPLLAKGNGGSLVNISSGLASHTRPGYGPYAAAKAGVISLTKTLALEHAPGVRVNAVAPAAVDTAFLRGGTGRSDERGDPHVDIDAYTRMTPLQRMAQPDDITGPILFLLSEEARYMTGQVLWVNGGNFMP
jgi:3-oxoacyl-[acyl-carrier protein] reductase